MTMSKGQRGNKEAKKPKKAPATTPTATPIAGRPVLTQAQNSAPPRSLKK
jgi:hypothetical protein